MYDKNTSSPRTPLSQNRWRQKQQTGTYAASTTKNGYPKKWYPPYTTEVPSLEDPVPRLLLELHPKDRMVQTDQVTLSGHPGRRLHFESIDIFLKGNAFCQVIRMYGEKF